MAAFSATKLWRLAALAAVAITGAGMVLAADRRPGFDNAESVDMFQGMKDGEIDVKFIPNNSHDGQIIIKNNTDKPLSVKLPDTFAGVPILAQAAAPKANNNAGGGASANQGVGGAGGAGGGGGGGIFNVAPEKTGKVKVPVVCLDHGKAEPNTRVPYEIRPIETYSSDPAIKELVNLFNLGPVSHEAMQAAAWHIANNMSWEQLAAKRIHHLGGGPDEAYFSSQDIKLAMQLSGEAERRAEANKKSGDTPSTTPSVSSSTTAASAN